MKPYGYTRGTPGGTPTTGESWSLDAQGNWAENATTASGSTTTDYEVHNSQNQTANINGTALAYDRDGNLTSDQNGVTYVYDAWNHLISVTVGTDTISYTYDALGRRITESDSASGTTTDFYYSGQQIVQTVAAGRYQGSGVFDLPQIIFGYLDLSDSSELKRWIPGGTIGFGRPSRCLNTSKAQPPHSILR